MPHRITMEYLLLSCMPGRITWTFLAFTKSRLHAILLVMSSQTDSGPMNKHQNAGPTDRQNLAVRLT